MSLREELERVLEMGNNMPTLQSLNEFISAATVLLRYHGQALLEAVDENEKLWDLVCWNIDNFRDHPLTDGYHAKWLGRAESLLTARSKTVDGGGA